MKTKILAKQITVGSGFKIIEKGDWIDLYSAETVALVAPHKEKGSPAIVFDSALIKLGIAMQLPKGFEAVLLPRSGTYKEFGIICRNSEGVFDNSYCGNNDEWRFPVVAFRNTTIPRGSRICQFRIQLSQKATRWQKIKWLLSSGVEIKWVDNLEGKDRGGFGSTGIK